MAAAPTFTLKCVNPAGREANLKIDSSFTVKQVLAHIQAELGWSWGGVTATPKGMVSGYGRKLDEEAILHDVVADGATLKALRQKKGTLSSFSSKGMPTEVNRVVAPAKVESEGDPSSSSSNSSSDSDNASPAKCPRKDNSVSKEGEAAKQVLEAQNKALREELQAAQTAKTAAEAAKVKAERERDEALQAAQTVKNLAVAFKRKA